MPMRNIDYWRYSLDNPEPEDLEEEPYIHDEYIAGLLLKQQGMSIAKHLGSSACNCSESRSCNESQVMGRAQGGDKLPPCMRGGLGAKAGDGRLRIARFSAIFIAIFAACNGDGMLLLRCPVHHLFRHMVAQLFLDGLGDGAALAPEDREEQRRNGNGGDGNPHPVRQRLDDHRRNQDGDQIHHLNQGVERGTGGIFERVAHGIANHARLMCVGALAAEEAVLDALFGVVPCAAGVCQQHRQQLRRQNRACQIAA
jgi:hypothetical protein